MADTVGSAAAVFAGATPDATLEGGTPTAGVGLEADGFDDPPHAVITNNSAATATMGRKQKGFDSGRFPLDRRMSSIVPGTRGRTNRHACIAAPLSMLTPSAGT
ncbi:MAG TPA: hypothetical protein VN697_05040 [Tepidiformaceae bacterium]|nr:hypothetical protein [Tepidiformaceae bacterium]